jgi:thiaminase
VASDGEQAREAEEAFVWVTHYERGFWDMAMSGLDPTGIQLR